MLNVWCGMGRLGNDPEVSETKDSTIVRFSIAVPQYNNDEVTWVNVTAFGKTAEFVEKYFTKGMRVVVRGRLDTGTYESKDKKGNVTNVPFARIIADGVDFADGKAEEESKNGKKR